MSKLLICFVFLMSQCKDAGFLGSNKSGSGSGSTAGTTGGTSATSGNTATNGGSTSPSTAGTISPAPGCISSNTPVDLVFGLDVTGSMSGNIQTVQDNIVSFAGQLKSSLTSAVGNGQPVRVKFGAIGYVDLQGENEPINLTEDINAFQTSIKNLKRDRGGIQDHCEGGLMAAEIASQMLNNDLAGEPNGIFPVIVMVTDNWSHNGRGPSGGRNFEPTFLINALMAPAFASNFLLVDSTYTNTSGPGTLTSCPGVPNSAPPSAQWDYVRGAWKQTHPTTKLANAGSNIGFPLQTNNLLGITQIIASQIQYCK